MKQHQVLSLYCFRSLEVPCSKMFARCLGALRQWKVWFYHLSMLLKFLPSQTTLSCVSNQRGNPVPDPDIASPHLSSRFLRLDLWSCQVSHRSVQTIQSQANAMPGSPKTMPSSPKTMPTSTVTAPVAGTTGASSSPSGRAGSPQPKSAMAKSKGQKCGTQTLIRWFVDFHHGNPW